MIDVNTTRTYAQVVSKVASNDFRIKTSKKINMFDYSLIIADIFDVDKNQVLNDLLNRRKMCFDRGD